MKLFIVLLMLMFGAFSSLLLHYSKHPTHSVVVYQSEVDNDDGYVQIPVEPIIYAN
jgi:hypothetical protein